MSTIDTTTRPATEGEVCECGRPAATIHQTQRFGDVPSCGYTHVTRDNAMPILPEITVPATVRVDITRADALLDELEPKLTELRTLVDRIRGVNDGALLGLIEAEVPVDGLYEVIEHRTGWGPLADRMLGLLADWADYDTTALSNEVLAGEVPAVEEVPLIAD